MSHVFRRVPHQVIHRSPAWQLPIRCQRRTPFPYRPFRPLSSTPDRTRGEANVQILNQKALDGQEQEVRVIQNQVKRPWPREGADKPAVPVKTDGKEDDAPITNGKLLTTPTEFAIEIGGHRVEVRVSAPTFADRTYYMRARLRRLSREIEQLSKIKRECDLLAHRSANRIAKAGFGVLTGWWSIVYYISFHTEPGWDFVEPITYLAGLATIMGGYLWFLYISKDLSYRAALNVTVSRRQHALYEARGFDQHRWVRLVQEANALRREILVAAVQYDVDWDEVKDLGDDVKEVLDEERTKAGETTRSLEKDEEYLEQERRKKDDSSRDKRDGSGS